MNFVDYGYCSYGRSSLNFGGGEYNQDDKHSYSRRKASERSSLTSCGRHAGISFDTTFTPSCVKNFGRSCYAHGRWLHSDAWHLRREKKYTRLGAELHIGSSVRVQVTGFLSSSHLKSIWRYTQCELMTVHYKQPILLIEFEEHKSFSLEVSSTLAYVVPDFYSCSDGERGQGFC